LELRRTFIGYLGPVSLIFFKTRDRHQNEKKKLNLKEQTEIVPPNDYYFNFGLEASNFLVIYKFTN